MCVLCIAREKKMASLLSLFRSDCGREVKCRWIYAEVWKDAINLKLTKYFNFFFTSVNNLAALWKQRILNDLNLVPPAHPVWLAPTVWCFSQHSSSRSQATTQQPHLKQKPGSSPVDCEARLENTNQVRPRGSKTNMHVK